MTKSQKVIQVAKLIKNRFRTADVEDCIALAFEIVELLHDE